MKAMKAMKGGAFNAFNALNLVHRSQGRGLVQHERSAFSRPTSLELPIAPIALPMMLFNVFQGFSHPHRIGESENPASLKRPCHSNIASSLWPVESLNRYQRETFDSGPIVVQLTALLGNV